MWLMGGLTVDARRGSQVGRSASDQTASLLIAPALGLATVGLAAITEHPLAYAAAVVGVPVLVVLSARAAAFRRRPRVAGADLRGYVPVSLWILVASVVGLSSHRFLGPAELIVLGFAYLGWIRRDAIATGCCVAALIAVAPADIKGPFVASSVDPTYAGLAIILVAAVLASIGAFTIVRHSRTAATNRR